jgi:hypothetical protein
MPKKTWLVTDSKRRSFPDAIDDDQGPRLQTYSSVLSEYDLRLFEYQVPNDAT